MAAGGTCGPPVATQAMAATGTATTVAAAMPTVEAVIGSPAVLSRTFHVTWSRAAKRMRATMAGSIGPSIGSRRPARDPRPPRIGPCGPAVRAPADGCQRPGRAPPLCGDARPGCGSVVHVAARHPPCPDQDAPDRDDDRGDDAGRVPVTDH